MINFYISNFKSKIMRKDKYKFIKKSSLFILIFICIIFILNSIYINAIGKNKLQIRKKLEWQEHKKTLDNATLDYAFWGDSHTTSGLNPEYIKNSFNFGNPGENYVETYFKIKSLIEKDNIKVKSFILELDTHTFSKILLIAGNGSLFNQLNYKDFMSSKDFASLSEKSRLTILFEEEIKEIEIIGAGTEIINYLIGKQNLKVSKLGWQKNTKDFSENKDSTLTAKKYSRHFEKDPILIEDKIFDYFQKILEIANENQIKIVFIKYPVSNEYDNELKRNNLPRDDYYKELFARIDETTTDYVVLDYYDLFFEHSEYLNDSDHLNYIGSEILSRKVADDLKKSAE